MCAGYGLELHGPNSDRGERPGLRGPIPPGDTQEGFALIEAWIAERDGRARITGARARNLNPIIRARTSAGNSSGAGVRGGDSHGSDRELVLAWWWLHVGGAPAKFTAFNSRSDRLLHSWQEPFQHRALLPATWYVEKGVRFALPAGEEFGMAAVTAPVGNSPDPGESSLTSYSLVTREAVAGAAEIHDRMPLVLPRDIHDEWLDPERTGDADLVRKIHLVSEEISRELVAVGPDQPVKRAAPPTTDADEHPRLF